MYCVGAKTCYSGIVHHAYHLQAPRLWGSSVVLLNDQVHKATPMQLDEVRKESLGAPDEDVQSFVRLGVPSSSLPNSKWDTFMRSHGIHERREYGKLCRGRLENGPDKHRLSFSICRPSTVTSVTSPSLQPPTSTSEAVRLPPAENLMRPCAGRVLFYVHDGSHIMRVLSFVHQYHAAPLATLS